jgi:hypothetical protein
MNKKWIALLTVISLTQASGLVAQASDLAFASPDVAALQQLPGEKSGFLAGALSGLVFPGLGSFYAGNNGHGVTHLAVAGASFGGMLVGSSSCEIVFAGPDSDCTLVGISAVVFLGNWIWSIFTGVNDTNAYNRSLSTEGLQVAPEVVAIRLDGQTTIGLQLLRFGL